MHVSGIHAALATAALHVAVAHADGLADPPTLSGELGMGLTYQSSPASDTGQGSFFGRLDIQAAAPVWVTVRSRLAPLTEVDTLVGFRFGHHYGDEGEAHEHTIGETATTRTVELTTQSHLTRSDFVAAIGLKSTHVLMPSKSNATENPTYTDAFSIYELGVQYHAATVLGSHRLIEFYGLYNPKTSSYGATATWHNSLSNPLSNHLTFGMEIGLVPATHGTMFYWSLVDIGYAFEL